jgi:membrane-associated phospholipid phosphatase
MEAIHFVQLWHNTWLDWFYETVTRTGEAPFMLAVVAFFLWRGNRRIGYSLGFALVVAWVVAFGLKDICQIPRPITFDSHIRVLRPEGVAGYSFPSGHMARAGALVGVTVVLVRRRWVWVAGGVFMLVMAASRLYMGAHTLADVVGGLAIAAGATWAGLRMQRWSAVPGHAWRVLALLVPVLALTLVYSDAAYARAAGFATGFAVGFLLATRYVVELPRGRVAQLVVLAAGSIGLYELYTRIGDTFTAFALMGVWMTFVVPFAIHRSMLRIKKSR